MQQLDSITERVVDIDPVESAQRLVLDNSVSSPIECCSKAPNVLDQKSRMGFPGGPELSLDAKVDSDIIMLEPATTTLGEMRWLLDLEQTETMAVERPRGTLSTRRHCQLDVVKCSDRHNRIIGERTRSASVIVNLQVRFGMETAKRVLWHRLSALPVLNGVAA